MELLLKVSFAKIPPAEIFRLYDESPEESVARTASVSLTAAYGLPCEVEVVGGAKGDALSEGRT